MDKEPTKETIIAFYFLCGQGGTTSCDEHRFLKTYSSSKFSFYSMNTTFLEIAGFFVNKTSIKKINAVYTHMFFKLKKFIKCSKFAVSFIAFVIHFQSSFPWPWPFFRVDTIWRFHLMLLQYYSFCSMDKCTVG